MNRRTFFALLQTLLVAIGFALTPATPAAAAPAPSIRYFVAQSSGAFEVIEGSNTGGRFAARRTGERIFIGGVGYVAVVGYTDRISRGETMFSVVGSNMASSGSIIVNGQIAYSLPYHMLAGSGWSNVVPTQAWANEIYILLGVPNGGVVARRVSIGRR
jgi:hypothetical protein